MIGAGVDLRRLVWLIVIGLALLAALIPAGASASTRAIHAANHVRAAAGATHQAGGHVRPARQYRELGRKVGVPTR